MRNLAPRIYRQRLIIEGRPREPVTGERIKEYLAELSRVLRMKALIRPVVHRSKRFGWAGWIHWEASGCHFYAWKTPFPFFSSDIYTCKRFDVPKAVAFTKRFFGAKRIAFKSI